MSAYNIKNNFLRRTVLIALLIPGAVCCLALVLWEAAKNYAEAFRGTPEEFMRVWRAPK